MNIELEMGPTRLEDVLIPEPLRHRLRQTIASDVMAYLFVGEPGTGKTTLAEIIGRMFLGESIEQARDWALSKNAKPWFEMNCAEINSAAELSGELPISISTLPMFTSRSVFYLDETHRLSPKAQDVLNKHLEKGQDFRRWLFSTTRIESLGPAFLRRCQIFELPGLQTPEERAELIRRAVEKTERAAPVDDFILALEKSDVTSPGVILAAFEAYVYGEPPERALASYNPKATKTYRAARPAKSGRGESVKTVKARKTLERLLAHSPDLDVRTAAAKAKVSQGTAAKILRELKNSS